MKNWGFQREKFYMGIYVGLFKRKRVLLIILVKDASSSKLRLYLQPGIDWRQKNKF